MFNIKQALRVASFFALACPLLIVGGAGNAFAGATATSHIGITKIASLSVARMETDQLYADQSNQNMRIDACMHSGGEPMPYRVSASSLMGQGGFQVSHPENNSNISYAVLWSDNNAQQRLVDSADISDVMQVSAGAACDKRTLSIEMDAGTYANASSSSHTDILSLIFIVE